MKKDNFLKYYILASMFLVDFVTFAEPGDDDNDGTLEDDDALPVPINGKLIWLAITAILFAIYIYKNYKTKEEV